MQSLEKDAIQNLISIIPNYPATRIMHISDGRGRSWFWNWEIFVTSMEFEYLLNVTDEELFGELKPKYHNGKSCIVHHMKFEKRSYANMAKLYDFVFVTATVPKDFYEKFLQKLHRSIKNGGNIILFLPKQDRELKYLYIE